MGPCPLPQPSWDRVRQARRRADDGRPRAHIRRCDRHVARTRGGDPAAAPPRALMRALLHPWSETFMQLALRELVFLGVVGGVVGCWVLFYELAYSTESLAHALFPGLVVAALVGAPLLAGGAAGVAAAAIAIALVRRVPLLSADAAVAVVITSLFGLGVILALTPSAPPGLDGLLFGDLLGVTRN